MTMSGPLALWMAAVRRAWMSFWLMRSIAISTPACLPNSFACSSKTWSAAGMKCDHCRKCSRVPCAHAGAAPAAPRTPAAADVLRKSRRVKRAIIDVLLDVASGGRNPSGTEGDAAAVLGDHDPGRLNLLDARAAVTDHVAFDVFPTVDERPALGPQVGVHDDLDLQPRDVGARRRRRRGRRQYRDDGRRGSGAERCCPRRLRLGDAGLGRERTRLDGRRQRGDRLRLLRRDRWLLALGGDDD